ncbi:MAG: thioredoxin-like domain-containing protein [Bacteroidales bacterium]|nr:thioredoxin-like domain-containing protein [Bacteroidales bacterium]
MKKALYAAAAALAMTAASCSHTDGWQVSGTVADADGSRMALEGYNNGLWYVIDSLDVRDGGKFDYRAAEPAPYPEIMRISLDGRSIYFPVDSIDHVTIATTAAGFGTSYTVEGSDDADRVRRIDSIINASVASRGAAATRTDEQLKRSLLTVALDAPTVMASYYLVNKSVDGKPLFDLSDRNDLRYFGAVAQRFHTERADDPRAAYLEQVFMNAQRASRPGTTTEIEVPETALFDIVRQDERGTKHSLAELAKKGGVIVLSFTAYGAETSPAYNVALNTIYEKYHTAGLEIYQISFDADETTWKQTAGNLPWITVWNSTTDSKQPLIDYNVGAVPQTFIIDRSGSLVARVTDPSRLDAEVSKVM